MIPQQNNLSIEDLEEYDEYSELINLLWTLRNGTTELDSIIGEHLIEISLNDSKPGSLARNLLIANDMIDYCEPIYLSDNLKSAIVIPEKIPNKISCDQRLKIFPNPAKDYIIVSYDLCGLTGNFQIIISSPEGRPLFQQKITGVKKQYIISTEKLSSSIYFIQLANDNNTIESKSFLISR
ncbi:MAG: T9SS type A sorting domain-containing protein [Bacteroidales bacterium]